MLVVDGLALIGGGGGIFQKVSSRFPSCTTQRRPSSYFAYLANFPGKRARALLGGVRLLLPIAILSTKKTTISPIARIPPTGNKFGEKTAQRAEYAHIATNLRLEASKCATMIKAQFKLSYTEVTNLNTITLKSGHCLTHVYKYTHMVQNHNLRHKISELSATHSAHSSLFTVGNT